LEELLQKGRGKGRVGEATAGKILGSQIEKECLRRGEYSMEELWVDGV